MRTALILLVLFTGWFGYKEISALRRCAIKRNFEHPTAAAIFNFAVKMVSGTMFAGATMLGMIMLYNWDLTSQLVTRILVNLFH